MRFLKRFSDQLYSLMRLMAGLLFACHGAQKLFGVLGSPQMVRVPLMLAAGIIEFFGGLPAAGQGLCQSPIFSRSLLGGASSRKNMHFRIVFRDRP